LNSLTFEEELNFILQLQMNGLLLEDKGAHKGWSFARKNDVIGGIGTECLASLFQPIYSSQVQPPLIALQAFQPVLLPLLHRFDICYWILYQFGGRITGKKEGMAGKQEEEK
jgi:hypothetical protein